MRRVSTAEPSTVRIIAPCGTCTTTFTKITRPHPMITTTGPDNADRWWHDLVGVVDNFSATPLSGKDDTMSKNPAMVVCALLAASLMTTSANAHPTLRSGYPPEESAAVSAPAEVRLNFSEGV